MALPQSDIQRRNGLGPQGSTGSRCGWIVGEFGLTAQVLPVRRMQSMLPRRRDWAKEYEGWKEAELDDEPIVSIWAPSRQIALQSPAG
jgi:hypothetical protein